MRPLPLNLLAVVWFIFAAALWLYSKRLRPFNHAFVVVGIGITATLATVVTLWPESGEVEPEELARNPVLERVSDLLHPRSGEFFVQSPIRRNEPGKADLTIGPPNVSPEDLRQEVQRLAGFSGVDPSAIVRDLTPRMRASLVCDRDCSISAKDASDRVINLGANTTWHWTVTPKVSGTTQITVTVTALIDVNGHLETPSQVDSFTKTVQVTVTAADRFSDALVFTEDYWAPIAALFAVIAAVVEWFLKRRQRRAGFAT